MLNGFILRVEMAFGNGISLLLSFGINLGYWFKIAWLQVPLGLVVSMLSGQFQANNLHSPFIAKKGNEDSPHPDLEVGIDYPCYIT